MNTIEKLGDDETFRQIVERSIISFEDDELTEVAHQAFHRCDKLIEVSIPNATNVGSQAFEGCSNLTTMYIGTELDDETAICTLGGGGTNSFPSSIGAIYVPYSLQDKYKTATNWSSFADKIKAYTGEAA